ncbi:putative RNA-binding protein [Escovopsis weberi]|uniref:Putative RNA-binding protein n=1 Tax=Escovopsis weberi TaxID=150374 RepID=A0A0M8MVX1_ESCWE|nr:putative RNA-binding protein [Escovopsis weberi]
MLDPENEATLQATANLSPVSPSPVHSVAVLAVPALQNTVDTIDAMVAAASAAPNGAPDALRGLVHDHDHDHDMAAAADPMEDPVDDDSFDDAYAEEAAEPAAAAAAVPPEHEAIESDDYAKTFDSPVEPQDGEDFEDHHVSSRQRESNNASLPLSSSPSSSSSSSASEPLISHTPDVPHLSPNASATAPQAAAVPPTAAAPQPQLEADPRSVVPLSGPSTRAPEPPAASDAPSAPTTQPIAGAESATRESQQSSVDIQQLVADLTARPVESSFGASDPSSAKSPVTAQASAASSSLPSTALPSPSSLPPRPPLPQTTSQSYASQHHPAGSSSKHSGDPAPHAAPGQSSFVLPGAPGASAEATGKHSAQASVSSMNAASSAPDGTNDAEYQRRWAQFMADERQYLSEARWDCFPEGSRIFIGNLSSDKVSKKDVFDLFHKFGRLAQISLKSAYGFVQYHTANEGWKALKTLEGTELKGRRIHLEISRMQEKPKKERNRSSDRNRGSRESGRRADKHNREENRSQRNHSPRRKDHYGRNDSYTGGGERAGRYYDSGRGRGRSRSPDYKRGDRDYRRRSPSPYGARSRHDAELEIPRRYGSDVPDVQIIMQPDVSRDFATWTEGAFKARGLKTAVMYLHPRMPKDQVIQRQAAEGVLAVVDLDLRSQSIGRIPIHLFDRSGGMHNVRFEQYVDLEPGTAAEIILRAKAPPAVSYGQSYGYPVHQYGAQPGPAAAGYPAMAQAGAYPPQQPSGPSAADIASLMGRVDNATLQQLLSTIQATSPGVPAPQGAHPGFPQAGPNPAAPSLGGQVDIQAILGSLNSNQGSQQHPPQAPYDGHYEYRGHPQGSPSSAAPGGDAAAAQVQNIMAQLARYRQ